MKDEEVERLLRAMPLKKCSRLPDKMPFTTASRPLNSGPIRRLASIRLPLWQAACAMLLAFFAYPALSTIFRTSAGSKDSRGEIHATEPPRITDYVAEGRPQRSDMDPFWKLPASYERMIADARDTRAPTGPNRNERK